MTRSEFIDYLAARHGTTRDEAAYAVDAVLDGIANVLAAGAEVTFTGFGKFSVAERGPRQGVNPRTGERITIAGGKVPKFSAGATLRASLAGDPDEPYEPPPPRGR